MKDSPIDALMKGGKEEKGDGGGDAMAIAGKRVRAAINGSDNAELANAICALMDLHEPKAPSLDDDE